MITSSVRAHYNNFKIRIFKSKQIPNCQAKSILECHSIKFSNPNSRPKSQHSSQSLFKSANRNAAHLTQQQHQSRDVKLNLIKPKLTPYNTVPGSYSNGPPVSKKNYRTVYMMTICTKS